MEMEITFPGGERVDAHFGGFAVHTDQPVREGGDGSAPAPFSLFLASIGTCAGIYVLRFCRQRGIPTEDLRVIQRTYYDRDAGQVGQIDIHIQLPEGFPEKYKDSIIRVAELCAVKKHLESPPKFRITTV